MPVLCAHQVWGAFGEGMIELENDGEPPLGICCHIDRKHPEGPDRPRL
jgi:hypothetical protein